MHCGYNELLFDTSQAWRSHLVLKLGDFDFLGNWELLYLLSLDNFLLLFGSELKEPGWEAFQNNYGCGLLAQSRTARSNQASPFRNSGQRKHQTNGVTETITLLLIRVMLTFALLLGLTLSSSVRAHSRHNRGWIQLRFCCADQFKVS